MSGSIGHSHLPAPGGHLEEDLPLHPEVQRWLAAYALADASDRDAVVADILDALNARLLHQEEEHAARIAEYETRVRVLTEQMPAILWSTDTELRVTSTTGRGLAAVGRKPFKDRRKLLFEILGTDDPESPPVAAHRRALRGESAIYEYAWLGRAFWVHIEPLRSPTGAIVGTIGAAVDITERKRAEAERVVQRERQARLDGMLFAARELASRVNRGLAASSDAIDLARLRLALPPHLFRALEAAIAALSEATRANDELQRLFPDTPDGRGDESVAPAARPSPDA